MMLKIVSRLGHLFGRSSSKLLLEKTCSIHTSNILNTYNALPKGTYEFPESNANFEVSTAEWHFVEQLFPMEHIPKPNVEPGVVTPSGWRAPIAKKDDHPYFVQRNRSHLFRIYKDTNLYKVKLMTNLKGIEGDIFALAEDLKEYLLRYEIEARIRVLEPYGVLTMMGDYKRPVIQFLYDKGF